MRRSSLFLLAMTLTLAMHAQTPKTLAALKDHVRPLLGFEGGDARSAERQLTLLAPHTAELRDRQVTVVGVEGTNRSVPTALLPAREWQSTQRQFGVKPGEFTVVLLGKDGGEKLRSHQPLSWETLQETIDAMPMRKEETGRGHR